MFPFTWHKLTKYNYKKYRISLSSTVQHGYTGLTQQV